MDILEQNTDDIFKPILGKKVQVINENGKKITGILQFAGTNRFGHFQVTVDRMPIWPVEPNNIKLVTTESIKIH